MSRPALRLDTNAMRRIFGFLVKAAVSLLLFYVALRSVDITALMARLAGLEWTWAAAAIVLLFVQIGVAAWRWWLVANTASLGLTLPQATRFVLIGSFFNQTLPSTIGGDAMRVFLTARATQHVKASLYSVLVDRAVGLIWLAALVLMCLPWSLDLIRDPVGALTLVAIGVCGVTGPLVLTAATRLLRPELERWRPTRHLCDLVEAMWTALAASRSSLGIAALSVAVHLLTVLAAWCLAQAIGSHLQALQALLLVPPVILISAVPLSIAGWGVRESAMIAAFSYADLPQSDGLAISVLLGLGIFIAGAAGGVLWVTGRDRMPPSTQMP